MKPPNDLQTSECSVPGCHQCLPPKLADDICKPTCERCRDPHITEVIRVHQLNLVRVERLSLRKPEIPYPFSATVQRIADDCMSARCEVHADLVRTACRQRTADQ